jgi:hypothetical protein
MAAWSFQTEFMSSSTVRCQLFGTAAANTVGGRPANDSSRHAPANEYLAAAGHGPKNVCPCSCLVSDSRWHSRQGVQATRPVKLDSSWTIPAATCYKAAIVKTLSPTCITVGSYDLDHLRPVHARHEHGALLPQRRLQANQQQHADIQSTRWGFQEATECKPSVFPASRRRPAAALWHRPMLAFKLNHRPNGSCRLGKEAAGQGSCQLTAAATTHLLKGWAISLHRCLECALEHAAGAWDHL